MIESKMEYQSRIRSVIVAGLSRFGGRMISSSLVIEKLAFGLLKRSDIRLFRSLRFRLFKAWVTALDNDRVVRWVSLANGVEMLVNVRDWCGITYVEPCAIEPITTTYLLKHLQSNDVFADIGANVGIMSLQAAHRIGPGGVVWSFEPNPRLVTLINESIRRNQFETRVHLVPIALAEADNSDRPFYLSNEPTNSGLSSLDPDAEHQDVGRMDMLRPLRVPVKTFDTFAEESRIERLDAVKIDVEGAEFLVIAGMRKTLAKLRPRFIICETSLDSPAAMALLEAGYQGLMMEPMQTDGKWGNILFTRMEKRL